MCRALQPERRAHSVSHTGARRTCWTLCAMSVPGSGTAKPQRVVICGGGIIGVSTAYYLATAKGLPCTLVERHEIAGAASGKAGGFLALDWNDHTPVGKLARKSFQLHKDLAATFGEAAIGYRSLETLSVAAAAPSAAAAGARRRKRLEAQLPGWLDGEGILASSSIGTTETTAQVHPQKLTRAMWAAAEAAGARLVKGTVQKVALGEGSHVAGVEVEGQGTLPADAVVIALGPWSGQAASWLPLLPGVGGQKAHSVVLRPAGGGVSGHAVFTSYRDARGKTREPEIYPRADDTVYVCGESSNTPIPEDPADVTIDSQACIERICEVAGEVASCLQSAEVEVTQACYLPVTGDGMPFMGRVPGVHGAYVGAGHSCWGILNGPATGLSLAELIADGSVHSVDIAAFDPARGGRHDFGAV